MLWGRIANVFVVFPATTNAVSVVAIVFVGFAPSWSVLFSEYTFVTIVPVVVTVPLHLSVQVPIAIAVSVSVVYSVQYQCQYPYQQP